MKVCHITSGHDPFDVRIFHKECRSLARAGHNVTLIAPADFDEQIVEGIRVLGVQRRKRRWHRYQTWRQLIDRVHQIKPDIVHFHDPDLLLITPFLSRYQLIYDCHERNAAAMLTKPWLAKPLRRPASILLSRLEPVLARWVQAVILVDDSQRSTFADTNKSLFLVRNFPLLKNSLISHARGCDRTVVHVGANAETRGCRVMIKAMQQVAQRMSGVRLLLVGPFNFRPYETRIRNLITNNRLEDVVIPIGEVPYDEVSDWIRNASIGLVAIQPVVQHQGGIPTKMFEYMAAGIPVVAGDIPPTRRYLAELDCGILVEPTSPKEYAAAIEYLLTNAIDARRLGAEGRKAVEHQYNWRNEETTLLSAYAYLEDHG